MSLARIWLRAELRRDWGRHAVVALLIALVGGVVLSTAAGAHRTATTFERFTSSLGIAQIEVQAQDPAVLAAIESQPTVRAAGRYTNFLAAPAGKGLTPGLDFIVLAPADRRYGRSIDRPLVRAGRIPDPGSPDEVFAGAETARALGLTVGSKVRLISIPAAQAEAFFNGEFDKLTLDGPAPMLRVVGIGRTRLNVQRAGYSDRFLLATPAFRSRHLSSMLAYGTVTNLRLAPGTSATGFVTAAHSALGPTASDAASITSTEDDTQGVRNAIGVQTIALSLIALAAGAAGLLAVGQAVARTMAASAEASSAALLAIGLGRWDRTRLMVVGLLPAVLAGSVVGAVAAWWGTRWFPPAGIARNIDTHPGTTFSPLPIVAGALLLATFALLVAAGVAVRHSAGGPSTRTGVARATGRMARLGLLLPPAPATGLRWMVPRRGRAGASARTALIATIVGVVGVAAALVFAAGMEAIIATPSTYGQVFDADAGGGDSPAAIAALRDQLLSDEAVGDVALVDIAGGLAIGTTTVPAYAFEPVRGQFSMTVLDGREPLADDEVALGPDSAAKLDVGIGDSLAITTIDGSKASFKVVGVGVFPTIENDYYDTGAGLTPAGFARVSEDGYQEVVFRWRVGADVPRATERLRDARLLSASTAPPGNIGSLELVQAYPAWLAAFLAALALIAVVHGVVVSLRDRRSEVAVLRAIGVSPRQVVGAVSTQWLALAVAGLVVGLPVGIALGRWAWRTNAENISVGGAQPMPWSTLTACSCAIVAILGIVGFLAGVSSSRHRPASALHTE